MNLNRNSTLSFASKLPQLGTTIFTVMSRLAQEVQAINLSQGFPDFDCHPELIEGIYQHMKSGTNQYAPMAGVMSLREEIARKTEDLQGYAPDPETEITVVSGASEAIFNALACLIRPGDEVIIIEPAYDLYKPIIELFGGVVVPVMMEEDYSIDWAKVGAAMGDKTRLLMVNSPHNPTGTILKAPDLESIQKILANSEVFLLSDEVYEHIIFDQEEHLSVLRYPDLRERSFAVFSFGKTFHATGWKIGYCIAPPEFSREFRKIHQYNTFSTFTPAQLALADFLKKPQHYLELPGFYQERRDYFRSLMQETPFQLIDCGGTYFQTVQYGHLSQENDVDYAQRLTREVGVASIPLSPFYTQAPGFKSLRFCFAKKNETLYQAVEKIMEKQDKLQEPA